jgi:hypothetical protein
MINPIKQNRIVQDHTFALRLLNFALDTQCNDACSEDEKESMISYSIELLRYQIQTASNKNEIDYLDRCNAVAKIESGLRFLGIS